MICINPLGSVSLRPDESIEWHGVLGRRVVDLVAGVGSFPLATSLLSANPTWTSFPPASLIKP